MLTLLGIEYQLFYDVDPEPTGFKFPSKLEELNLTEGKAVIE